jgi:hypothetical protein
LFEDSTFIKCYNYIDFKTSLNNIGARGSEDYYIESDYTLLKYKDVKLAKSDLSNDKEELVKEDFKEWLSKDLNNDTITYSTYSDIERETLHTFFNSAKERKDYMVERIITKCIEYYNNKYPDIPYEGYYNSMYWNGEGCFYQSTVIRVTKPSMLLNNSNVFTKVKKELKNFKGKNLLKYYFIGEF